MSYDLQAQSKTEEILEEVHGERFNQVAKWGFPRDHGPRTWLTILMEEVGETAEASLGRDPKHAREELVQVAASAVAAIEAIDRNHE